MKGRLISVNKIPHALSDTLSTAFELSMQDRAELKDGWLGAECIFDAEGNYASIVPGSIIPVGISTDAWNLMSILNSEELTTEQKIEEAKDYIFHNL